MRIDAGRFTNTFERLTDLLSDMFYLLFDLYHDKRYSKSARKHAKYLYKRTRKQYAEALRMFSEACDDNTDLVEVITALPADKLKVLRELVPAPVSEDNTNENLLTVWRLLVKNETLYKELIRALSYTDAPRDPYLIKRVLLIGYVLGRETTPGTEAETLQNIRKDVN